ncbi:hypothetical protein LTR78_008632 [Recurvomyces mirabilis]|uniref:Signal peptide peptidase n=1 Tax=Recurvomyces mirabilis TaxID=574656 RepID=A0AAE0WFN6_9PEZI|nr:hypothetical protein LTR78_008632 [Recurvomyces mirabilis]KAK5153457.1 hypothetical protein LTS14_007627 [Recurvomyces mirabilis]
MDDSTNNTFLAAAMDHFTAVRPFIPMYIHLLFSALAPIYTGAHASLSRPSSAAKPVKVIKDTTDDDDEDEDEDKVQKMEGLSPSDAIVFPITAGCVLAGLYFLIQRYGANLINMVMSFYFAAVGIYSVATLWKDGNDIVNSFVFPTWFAQGKTLYKVDGTARKAVAQDTTSEAVQSRDSPIPYIPAFTKSFYDNIWALRAAVKQRYTTSLHIPSIITYKGSLTLNNLISVFVGLGTIFYANIISTTKPWYLTNLQGFAVCYQALQFMSPTTFFTGTLILTGLFFYDIWAVFFTPLMVTVAKNLDQPIKMVFPRPDDPGATMGSDGKMPPRSYSMLGLGDIVLPGLMIGLALRFDLYMFYLKKQKRVAGAQKAVEEKEIKTKHDDGTNVKAPYISPAGYIGDRFWTALLPTSARPARLNTSFPKPYFHASVVGYIVGMMTTLAVMSIWNHAQPALLYLVPGVLISLWSTALVRGEISEMWNYSEGVSGEQVEGEDGKEKKEEMVEEVKGLWEWMKEALLGSSSEPEAKIVEKATAADKKKTEDKKSAESGKKAEKDDVIISFSIAEESPRAKPTIEGSESSLEDTLVVGRNE